VQKSAKSSVSNKSQSDDTETKLSVRKTRSQTTPPAQPAATEKRPERKRDKKAREKQHAGVSVLPPSGDEPAQYAVGQLVWVK
jgi:hypothetical protein